MALIDINLWTVPIKMIQAGLIIVAAMTTEVMVAVPVALEDINSPVSVIIMAKPDTEFMNVVLLKMSITKSKMKWNLPLTV